MSATNDIRTMLVDTAERLFADHCTQQSVESAKQFGWSERRWQVLEQMQLTLISIPEELGGAGGTVSALAAVLRVAGRYCAPVPLAENALLAAKLIRVAASIRLGWTPRCLKRANCHRRNRFSAWTDWVGLPRRTASPTGSARN